MHYDLDNFSVFKYNDETAIIAAGEFEVKKKIDFNLLSGTYHKEFGKGKTPENIDRLVERVKGKIRSIGFNDVEYINMRSIIDTSNIRSDEENMRILSSYFSEGGKRRNKTKKRK